MSGILAPNCGLQTSSLIQETRGNYRTRYARMGGIRRLEARKIYTSSRNEGCLVGKTRREWQ